MCINWIFFQRIIVLNHEFQSTVCFLNSLFHYCSLFFVAYCWNSKFMYLCDVFSSVVTCVWWSGAGWPVLSNSVGEEGRASSNKQHEDLTFTTAEQNLDAWTGGRASLDWRPKRRYTHSHTHTYVKRTLGWHLHNTHTHIQILKGGWMGLPDIGTDLGTGRWLVPKRSARWCCSECINFQLRPTLDLPSHHSNGFFYIIL